MRSSLAALLCVAVLVSLGGVTSADEGDIRFRRTTPRAALAGAGGAIVIGVPGGRAWGVESELRPLPPPGTLVVARLDVTDDIVSEAFLRVAYYGSSTRRTRQLAVTDSEPVTAGRRMLVAVELDPPEGAVAYRVRVLVRLFAPAARSSDDAVTAVLRTGPAGAGRFGSLFTRLLP